eukprot:4705676-Prorocentrum_lima.AAC.1
MQHHARGATLGGRCKQGSGGSNKFEALGDGTQARPLGRGGLEPKLQQMRGLRLGLGRGWVDAGRAS